MIALAPCRMGIGRACVVDGYSPRPRSGEPFLKTVWSRRFGILRSRDCRAKSRGFVGALLSHRPLSASMSVSDVPHSSFPFFSLNAVPALSTPIYPLPSQALARLVM